MVFRNADSWAMEARCNNQTHHIELNAQLDYSGPLFRARLDTQTFAAVNIEVSADARAGDALPLEPAATMYVLLNGLKTSMPHLPVALPAELASAGRIGHPGYAE